MLRLQAGSAMCALVGGHKESRLMYAHAFGPQRKFILNSHACAATATRNEYSTAVRKEQVRSCCGSHRDRWNWRLRTIPVQMLVRIQLPRFRTLNLCCLLFFFRMHKVNAEYRDQKEIRLALDANWDNDKQPLLVFEKLRQRDLKRQGKLEGRPSRPRICI